LRRGSANIAERSTGKRVWIRAGYSRRTSKDRPNVYATPSAGPQDAPLYLWTDVTPEELFQALGRLRKEACDEIHRLIRFLDKTDDYVSRELEDQVDDWPCDDNELDGPENGEDEESDPREASLGSLDGRTDQTGRAAGNHLEQDDGETGIVDQDGLDEQVPFRDWMGVGMV
jgi:hypothetical protein